MGMISVIDTFVLHVLLHYLRENARRSPIHLCQARDLLKIPFGIALQKAVRLRNSLRECLLLRT